MKERFHKIMKGLLILLCSIGGLWEYMQLSLNNDIPQAIVITPVIGLVAVVLRRISFVVLGTTAAVSVVFQMVSDEINRMGIVEISKINIILNNLPAILLFMVVGIAGGFLVRVLVNRKKPIAVGIGCCILGVVLTFGIGVVTFGNPLYFLQARTAINRYADKYRSEEYPVSEVNVYFSSDEMEYQGQVVMSDGYRYALYHDRSSGTVYEIGQSSSQR